MSVTNAELIAEDLMGYVPLPPSGERHDDEEAVFSLQPGPNPLFASVSRVRSRDLVVLVARADEWFAARGQSRATWFVGPHTTPTDIVSQLTDAGAEHTDTATAMVLDSTPRGTDPEGIEVRRVATLGDFSAFRRVIFDLPDAPPEKVRAVEDETVEAWRQFQAMNGRRELFLAAVDGAVLAAGGMALTAQGVVALSGGATVPAARGRGLYAALVRARWAAARDRGATSLVTQASAMSRPVLEKLGFRAVAQVTVVHRVIPRRAD